jgi:peptide/nickel transport system permease protein
VSVRATAWVTPGARLRRPRFLTTARGIVGLVMFVFVLVVALLGPLMLPHPLDQPIGVPGSPPGPGAPLGTDFLGRDVLSRLLHGGLSVFSLAVGSVAVTYIVGIGVGMVAGLSRSWFDDVLMRTVDVLIVFPPLLLLLVLVTGAGSGTLVLLVGIVLVLSPGVARVVRTATIEISTTGYVEAAVARGERTLAIMRWEILPNIAQVIVADAGIRSSGAIFLVASLSFLGVGPAPPAADWGLMISENRPVITSNIWAVAAPALMLALLMISVNLIGDAYIHTIHRSRRRQ